MAVMDIDYFNDVSQCEECGYNVFTDGNKKVDMVLSINPDTMSMIVSLSNEHGNAYLKEGTDELATDEIFVNYIRVVGRKSGKVYFEKTA